MFLRAFFSFFVSSSTAILNKVERKYYLLCGCCGMVTSLAYSSASDYVSAPMASLLTCIALTVISQLLGHLVERPSLIFTISGIMPIVPCSLLFKTFNALAENDYNQSLSYGAQAILVGVSIALGFFFNESFAAILGQFRHKKG